MSTRRYRLILKEKGKTFAREVGLNNDDPSVFFSIGWSASTASAQQSNKFGGSAMTASRSE